MQNSPQWIAAYYGILCANAVVVPVNPMNKADELGHYITDPEAKVAIAAADLAAVAPICLRLRRSAFMTDYFKGQGRYRHLDETMVAQIQAKVTERWERLVKLSEAGSAGETTSGD
jgi:acyl-CoA synthetase (AMP-forming)/AMP-acid ligase II